MAKQDVIVGMTGAALAGAINGNDTELYARSAGIYSYDVKDYGAKGDGLTDDTAAIQAAITAMTAGEILFIPTGVYMVKATGANASGDDGGIRVTKSMSILMERGVELKAITGNKVSSQVIKVLSTSFVEIFGGKITGDWAGRVDSETGNHCISIENSSNVYLHDLYISQASGDCLSIYRTGAGVSKNIMVDRCELTDYRRWGIFADCDENILVRSCNIHDVLSDILYGGGIDIEYHGEGSGSQIKNVVIDANIFDSIGSASHSYDGAMSLSGGANGLVDGIKFINNIIRDCASALILTNYINANVFNNTFINNVLGVNVRGKSTVNCSTIISNNSFDTNGGISFAFGDVSYLYIEFITGVIVSGNIFNDFTSNYCIRQLYCQTSQLSFVNNVFKNCANIFTLDPRFGGQHYFKGNVSIGADGLSINDVNTFGKATTKSESRGVTTGTPTAGTYEIGEFLNETGFVAAGYMGLICITAGTMEVINTTCVANGTTVVTVTDPYSKNISIGQYVKVNGGAALKVTAIGNANNVTLSGTVGAGSGLTFVNSPAVFKKFATIEP